MLEDERNYMTEDEIELMEQAKFYESNTEKLRAAGKKAVSYCEECFGCKYYEDVGMTDADLIEPITHGICHHKEMQNKNDCKGREER